MNLNTVIQSITSALETVRNVLVPIPGLLLVCTSSRRPGFLSTLTSAKVYADMNQNENDEILKAFIYNVIDKIKKNIQDDGVCFVAIPPNQIVVNLNGGNMGGPAVLVGSNKNYVFAWAIIR